MATPYQSNLLGDIYRRQSQRRALTGLPSSYQEQRGLFDAALDYDARKANEAGLLEQRKAEFNRTLALQERAQKDAKNAAMVSGAGQLAMLPLAYGAARGAGLLGGTAAAAPAAAPITAQGMVAPVAGAATAQGAATAPVGLQSATSMYGQTLGAAGEGAGASSAAGGGAGLLGGASLSGLGLGAAAFTGQVALGKSLQPKMDEAGFHYTGKYGTYAGLPGATTGFVLDLGNKVWEGAKDFFGGIF